MTEDEHRAFGRAILAAGPLIPGPWGVYADRLEEAGDPLAEPVRLLFGYLSNGGAFGVEVTQVNAVGWPRKVTLDLYSGDQRQVCTDYLLDGGLLNFLTSHPERKIPKHPDA